MAPARSCASPGALVTIVTRSVVSGARVRVTFLPATSIAIGIAKASASRLATSPTGPVTESVEDGKAPLRAPAIGPMIASTRAPKGIAPRILMSGSSCTRLVTTWGVDVRAFSTTLSVTLAPGSIRSADAVSCNAFVSRSTAAACRSAALLAIGVYVTGSQAAGTGGAFDTK